MGETNKALEALSGSITPTRVAFLYKMGLGIVALAMVLLPLVYIALIVLVGKLVWWHIMHDAGIFNHVHGRGILVALLLYLGPAVAGVIFILFLVKPLFTRGEKPAPTFKLVEADEPVLFEFVRKICAMVGAPEPREIRLDTQVNASAGFRRGWLSFFGNDLVLVIGMPLAGGMTMRQLAGVLAHEFGHFAQGTGMRLNFIIRSVNGWFARVVFERDRWDQKLEEWSRTDEGWLKVVFLLAKGGVWLGRKVLFGLMYAGHAISCFMSRQMEFDADSYEAKLAGSSEFAKTSERLLMLSAAHGAAMSDAYETYQSRELPDDITALVVWREQTIPEEIRAKIKASSAESKTEWNHTHPSDKDRIQTAEALAAPGAFHYEGAASELFSDFSATSIAVTQHYFQHVLDVPADKAQFRSAARIVEDRKAADASDKALDLFYGKNFHFLRARPIEPGASEVGWEHAREQMKLGGGDYREQLVKLEELNNVLLKQMVGADLLGAQFTLPKPADFHLSAGVTSEAQAAINKTQGELRELFGLMQGYEIQGGQRLSAALEWWQAHHPGDGLQRLLAAQRPLASVVSHMLQVSRDASSLKLLFENAENHGDGAVLERQLRAIANRIEIAANHCVATLGAAEHPYLDQHPPIAQVLHLPEKSANEWERAFELASVCSEALIPLFVRIMGDLCGLALEAEKERSAGLTGEERGKVGAEALAEPLVGGLVKGEELSS